jgi:hypothetical protein
MIYNRKRKQKMATWLSCVTLACSFPIRSAIGETPQNDGRQKISEGQYVRLKDNAKVPGSEQSWTLWRVPGGGFELEDHFTLVNPADQVLSAFSGARLSSELQKKLDTAVSLTDLFARLGADHKPELVALRGKKLVDGRAIESLKCEVGTKEVRCKGIAGSAKLQRTSAEEFFYAFPFPMLLSGWLTASMAKPTDSSAGKLVCLDAGPSSEDKLNLLLCDRQIVALEDESLMIGDRSFRAHKANIKLGQLDKLLLNLTIWYGAPGLVYAMEGGGPTGERVALVEYKKYSDF